MTEQASSGVWRVVDNTRVTFPGGSITGTSRVLAAGDWGLIVEETPFSPRRPDQRGDTGSVEIAGWTVSVVDCLVGAVELGSGRLMIGDEIPVRPGASGWHWVVVHVLQDGSIAAPGSDVVLLVDPVHRRQSAITHTAHHLSSLALNAMLASLCGDGVPADSLGHADFAASALASSSVTSSGFRDTYRIRTGPVDGDDVEGEPLDGLATMLGRAVTDRVRRWLSRRAPIRMISGGPYLTDPCSWECDLPQGTARVLCRGPHADDLSLIGGVQVTASLSADGTELTLSGTVRPAQPGSRGRIGPRRAARDLHTGLKAIRH
jgi:alanyl-tRNA synthetase